jgi:hypothetical protein
MGLKWTLSIALALGGYVQCFHAATFLQYAHTIHIFARARRLHIDHMSAVILFYLANDVAHRAPIAVTIIAALLAPVWRLRQYSGTGDNQHRCEGKTFKRAHGE